MRLLPKYMSSRRSLYDKKEIESQRMSMLFISCIIFTSLMYKETSIILL